jgi:peptide deformylase
MPVRPVVPIGDPVLRTATALVAESDITSPSVQRLIDDLIDTMHDAHGAGIAATQIGVGLRVMTVEVKNNPRYPYKPAIPLTVAINPVVTPLDGEMITINEGCLSVPLRGDLQRNVNIEVSYFDRQGTPHTEIKRGLTAGTWQHECDHLDGTLIVDRIDPRTMATWDQFDRHQRADFVERISTFVDRIGS